MLKSGILLCRLLKPKITESLISKGCSRLSFSTLNQELTQQNVNKGESIVQNRYIFNYSNNFQKFRFQSVCPFLVFGRAEKRKHSLRT